MNKLFTKWLKEEFDQSKNLLPPKLDDRLALLFLQNYLLGEEMVHCILLEYSKKYRKEYKESLKGEKENKYETKNN